MKIDCVLKTWVKDKGAPDNDYYSVPPYEVENYTNDHDVKYALQIVHIGEKGEEAHVLVEKVFIPCKKAIHYIYFCSVGYVYDEEGDLIYSLETLREI